MIDCAQKWRSSPQECVYELKIEKTKKKEQIVEVRNFELVLTTLSTKCEKNLDLSMMSPIWHIGFRREYFSSIETTSSNMNTFFAKKYFLGLFLHDVLENIFVSVYMIFWKFLCKIIKTIN